MTDGTLNTPEQQHAELDDLLKPLRAVVALLGVMIIGFGLGAGIMIASLRGNDRAIVEQRTQSRHTACLRDNEIRRDAGDAAAKKARDFIDAQKAYTGAGPSTGRLKAAEDAYVASQRAVTLEAYPHRDCTPEGIQAYYENPPTTPQEPCVPDGKGLCKP